MEFFLDSMKTKTIPIIWFQPEKLYKPSWGGLHQIDYSIKRDFFFIEKKIPFDKTIYNIVKDKPIEFKIFKMLYLEEHFSPFRSK
jgi:hypothetical protein